MNGDIRFGAAPILAQGFDVEDAWGGSIPWLIGISILLVIGFVIALVMFSYGKLWLQARAPT
jgi:hypothetical protein